MSSSFNTRQGLMLFGLILFGAALYMGTRDTGSHSSHGSASSPVTEQPITTSTENVERENKDAVNQARRAVVVEGLNGIFRRHGLDAHASLVNEELVVSVEGITRLSERDDFAGTYFSKKTQQGLCDIGIKKVLISGSGVFSDGTEYGMACKMSTESTAQKKQKSDLIRQAFAAQMSSDLKASPVVERVEANGTELVLIGKNGIDVRTIKSSFIPGMGPSFISSVCGMHFHGLRVRKSIGDPGTLISFHCSKN